MDELNAALQEDERRRHERSWLDRDQFLFSIPKDDAKEILGYVTECANLVDSDDPMFIKIHMENLQRMMARARRRVYVEVAIWGGILAGVASTVAVILANR